MWRRGAGLLLARSKKGSMTMDVTEEQFRIKGIGAKTKGRSLIILGAITFGCLALFIFFSPMAIATGQWTLTGSMNTTHGSAPMTKLQNGKVLVVSGSSSTGVTGQSELY